MEVEEERLLVCRVGELLGILEPVDEPGAFGGGIEDMEEGRS